LIFEPIGDDAHAMGLIDTHTHLESFVRDGTLGQVLARARMAGVEEMIAIGTSPEDWDVNRKLAGEHAAFVHATVGLHPCSVDEKWAEAVGAIEAYWNPGDYGARGGRPVALGECGLDRFHLPADPSEAEKIFTWQRQAFAAQLEIVKRQGCPLVVHSRGAFQECVAMIDASGVEWDRVVFHCFTEGVAEMAELTRRGGFGSFTGIVTYKNAQNVRDAAKAQGLERLMIETDAPYLTPMPHRGKPNEPAFLKHTAEYCAKEVFGVDNETLAVTTTANARRFFGV
jgi:TatD DNase family protein